MAIPATQFKANLNAILKAAPRPVAWSCCGFLAIVSLAKQKTANAKRAETP
jgi:hypothetical protein